MSANRYLNPKQFRKFNADPNDEHTDVPSPEWTGAAIRTVLEGPVHKNYMHPDNAHWTAPIALPPIRLQSEN